jgi:hypothetical protein
VPLFHPVATAYFHMRTHPDANAASDSSAPDPLAKAFGELHPLRAQVRHHREEARQGDQCSTRAEDPSAISDLAPFGRVGNGDVIQSFADAVDEKERHCSGDNRKTRHFVAIKKPELCVAGRERDGNCRETNAGAHQQIGIIY